MKTNWQARALSPNDLILKIKDNSTVFIHGAAAVPIDLVESLCSQTHLTNITTYHVHLGCETKLGTAACPYIQPISFFTGADLRPRIATGNCEYVPIFLSDIPNLFYSQQVHLNVALIQVSPPDEHGICSLGTSVDCARAAVDTADLILAEVNQQMPRTFGNSSIPLSKIDFFTCTDRPIIEHAPKKPTAVETRIGEIIADLVTDRSTLQMGIGAIPDAALAQLNNKQDLGVHTEMFSDQLVTLFESGAITNKYKAVHPGRIATSFVNGTKRVYDFVHNNPLVEFHSCDRTNDTSLIRKNNSVVAINSALQVDLSGQVCADSLGHSIYSGIGGQMDFIRAAALSVNGKAIIALPSTAAKGTVSRIVNSLSEGAGVVTTRGHVHWLVTEYGAVNLHGKSLRQRAEALISIAHPDFRAELTAQVNGLRHFTISAPLPAD